MDSFQITQTRQVLRVITLLPREIDEIILEYLRSLCEIRYTWYDLRNISNDVSHTFTLIMRVRIFRDSTLEKFLHNGEVEVTRFSTVYNWSPVGIEDSYNFEFMNDGTRYELINGSLYGDIIDFDTTPISPWTRITFYV